MGLSSIKGEEEMSRTIRDEPPTHFELEINSFSLLSKSSFESYESGDFDAGGHKWKLSLYPKGNKDNNGEGHISLYLGISDTDSFNPGWEVHALFRFLVLNQLRDKYLLLQDSNERARRFRPTKTRSGFDRLITLKEFNDPSNGYLVNDTCVFGAEVFVHRESVVGIGERLSMTVGPENCNYRWKIEKFSELVKKCHSSKVFAAGCYNWRVEIWPKGHAQERGKSLSLFLVLDNSASLPAESGVYVEAQLRVVDQVDGKHVDKKLQAWYNKSSNESGLTDFLSLSSFIHQSKGYLVNDVCIIEAHLLLVGEIEKLES